MMYVFYKKDEKTHVASVYGSIPKVFKEVKTLCEEVEYVYRVQADCDELTRIEKAFGGLPFSKNSQPVVNYYGDHAKFIVGNWNAIRFNPPTT